MDDEDLEMDVDEHRWYFENAFFGY